MLLYNFSKTKFFSKFPFTYIWIIKKAIGTDVTTVLDLGCAKGIFTEVIAKGERWRITGVELFSEYIKDAIATGIYSEVVKGDVINLPKKISTKKYDVVLCHQVIEHVDKNKGKTAIKEWEKLAKKRVVIGTTVGFTPYDTIEHGKPHPSENKLLMHKSGWTPDEMTNMGYRVYGQGLRMIYGEDGIARKFPEWLLPLFKFVSFVFSPICYFFPSMAQIMICVKDVS